MAKVYKTCPGVKQRGARDAWTYFVQRHDESPQSMRHMANCFKRDFTLDGGNYAGFWVADYKDFRDYYNPQKPKKPKVRNIFEFIHKQNILERIVNHFKGDTNG